MALLVGGPAPDFTAPAVDAKGQVKECMNFHAHIRGKYALLFFYPMDFTFVCPTELIALNNRYAEFKKRNVEVFGISIDSHFVHQRWRNTPIDQGGIGPVQFTLISDIRHEVCKLYDVESEGGVAYRGSFLIDSKGFVRQQIVNDLPLGRDINEALRMVDALQFFEQHGEVCPAGWNKDKKGMTPTTEGVATYLASEAPSL